MATTPEGKVKKKVKDYLTSKAIYYTMPFTAGYGASGVPDILVCFQGKFIAIECKAKGNKPTALQAEHMKRIQRGGGTAVVIDENNADGILDSLFNDTDDGRC
jgi:Holliday junction resolvase